MKQAKLKVLEYYVTQTYLQKAFRFVKVHALMQIEGAKYCFWVSFMESDRNFRE